MLGQVDAAASRGPLELLEELGNPEVGCGKGQHFAGAGAAAGAEGRQAEVAAEHADVLLLEALGAVLLGLGPDGGVMGDRPHVHHGGGAGGDEVSADVCIVHGEASPREERARGVHAEGLLHDALDVREVGDVSIFHGATLAHDSVQLSLRLGLDVRVQDHPRHDPLHQDGDGVRASEDHFLITRKSNADRQNPGLKSI
jgi:hypothetical protein